MLLKKTVLASSLFLLIGAIVVPTNRPVNTRSEAKGVKQTADGMPLPPPKPNMSDAVEVADGMPLPPPKPNVAA